MLSSRNGVLEVELTAAPTRTPVGGRDAHVWTFNGSLPGPTLRLRPGDTLRVAMRNGLREATNLHVHGLHVSPQDNGDNPFVGPAPGSPSITSTPSPRTTPGTYWYHPHHHGMAAAQLAAGLYGAIVVEDPGAVPVSRERLLVVSDLTLDASGHLAGVSLPERMMGREGRTVLVNGQIRPQARAAPGERERWRVVNACPARFLRLRLDGQTVRLLGRDGQRLRVPQDITEADLAPGNRVDLLVEAREGSSVLATDPVDRGSMNGMMGGRMGDGPFGTTETIDLMSLTVHGPPVPPLGPIPGTARPRDLRNEPITARRTLDFAMGMGMMMGGGMGSFTINGKEFDPDRLDETVRAGTVEEWTLTNSSPMDHPMHLHVWPMQVIEDEGRNLSEPVWQDVVSIPASGQVKVRIAFDDFSGRTVFHCHILDHEDLGMMGTVEAR